MDTETRELALVSARRIGRALGVSAGTIRSWARRGWIPYLTLPSGRFVFDPDQVMESIRRGSRAKAMTTMLSPGPANTMLAGPGESENP